MAPMERDLYPSRDGRAARLLPRQDPIVYGDEQSGPLDAPQLLRYQQQGYVTCEGAFDASEVAQMQGAVGGLCMADALREGPEVVREPDTQTVRCIFCVHAFSEPLARLTRDRRLVRIAQQILGGPVYVHQSRVLFVPAFSGRESFWRSDFETWHVDDGVPRMRTLTIALNLTENNDFNGPMMVIPGSHREFVACAGHAFAGPLNESLRRRGYGSPDRPTLTRFARDLGVVAPRGRQGSLVVFDCNLMYAVGANITPFPRCSVLVVYNSTENRPLAPYSGFPRRPDYVASREFTPIRLDR